MKKSFLHLFSLLYFILSISYDKIYLYGKTLKNQKLYPKQSNVLVVGDEDFEVVSAEVWLIVMTLVVVEVVVNFVVVDASVVDDIFAPLWRFKDEIVRLDFLYNY